MMEATPNRSATTEIYNGKDEAVPAVAESVSEAALVESDAAESASEVALAESDAADAGAGITVVTDAGVASVGTPVQSTTLPS